jgi:ribonuclease HI
MECIAYCHIEPQGTWNATFAFDDQTFVIQGKETQEDSYRNEIQATLEVLQFIRNWVNPSHVTIYTNSQYCISCVDKWIPNWITKGFRIGHTGKMRPNSDLLVKLHAFGTCMNFDLVQHYDDYDQYQELIKSML